jgi:hypothetical protein
VAVDVATLGGAALGVGVRTRVGSVQRHLRRTRRLQPAVAVVGEREVHLAGDRVHGAPLGAVHARGAHGISGQACVHQHVGLVGKAVGGVAGDAAVADRQLDPLAAAVGVETGHVQLAVVQVLVAGGHAVGRRGVGGGPRGVADELVDVLAARVVAHVHRQRLARGGQRERGALVRKAAQRRALGGLAGLVVGVDLHHVAEAVHLVAVVVAAVGRGTGAGVDPACVAVVAAGAFPAVARRRAFGTAIAVERRHALVVATRGVVARGPREVAEPVLLTRQQRAPGGLAGAAVVQRAAGVGAGGAVSGDQQRVATRRPADGDVGQGGDAVVEGRCRHRGPLAVAAARHLDHRHAVHHQFLVDFGRGARQRRRAAIGVQEEAAAVLVGGGFVVHAQQAAVAGGGAGLAVGRQAEPFHAVVVVAGAQLVLCVGAVVAVGGHAGGQRVAQRVDGARGVAGGHAHAVGQALGHGAEAQRRDGRVVIAATAGRQPDAAQHRGGRRAHRAAQQPAARQPGLQHLLEWRVAAGVGVFIEERGAVQGLGIVR